MGETKEQVSKQTRQNIGVSHQKHQTRRDVLTSSLCVRHTNITNSYRLKKQDAPVCLAYHKTYTDKLQHVKFNYIKMLQNKGIF